MLAVGVEPGYRRAQDVEIQVELALGGADKCLLASTLDDHARNVGLAVLAARQFARDLREKARLMAARKQEEQ
jgi:hypothetical protein